MKRFFALVLLLFFLAGCAPETNSMDRAMALRSKILASALCFEAQITADFGRQTYTFTVDCNFEKQGKLTFKIISPESIAGISGVMDASGGALTFDGQALSFPLLADGQVSPVSGPWVLMCALRSGYLTSCSAEAGQMRLSIDDSYEKDALHLDIWLDQEDLPKQAEIFWRGRRVLSVTVTNFRFM